MEIRRVVLSAWLLVSVCVVSVLALPGASTDHTVDAAEIAVEYKYPHVTVRVSRSTDLLTVLEELCRLTNANCELAPELAQVSLEPMVVQGTWFEVVRKLFEGKQFGLAAMVPSPQQAGRLFVRWSTTSAKTVEQPAAALAGNRATRANGEAEGEVGAYGGPLSSSAGARPGGTKQEPQTNQNSTPNGAIGLSQGQSSVGTLRGGGADPVGSGSALRSSLKSQTTEPPATGALSEDQARTNLQSIHDLYVGPPAGNLSSPPEGMAVFPFPDENGNPVLVQITNQPITMLPFPDSQGRPIPVAPGVPGLKLQNPFPPTVGPK
jgi:hypothetical protein